MTNPLFTIGHSTRSLDELTRMLQAFGITTLIDVRTVPRSRTNPQFNRETLAGDLALHGIRYEHEAKLGGLRHARKASTNTGWKNASFRGYADHMNTPEFREGIEHLIETAANERCAIMCAEAVPWRCHRNLIADALTARGLAVRHIMTQDKAQPHKMTAFARVDGKDVSYPGQDKAFMTTKKKSATAKGSATPLPSVRNGAAIAVETTALEQQMAIWDGAVRLFGKQNYAEACELFRKAAAGPAAHIADKARSYLQICERKVAMPAIECHTADDHFNYGVERLNARDFEQARVQFGQALSLQPEGDHIFFTLALCCGLSGDGNGACENLKRAIDLEPRNRILARQDPEFSALATQNPVLRTMLSGERA